MAVTINGDGVVDVGGNASSAAYVRLYEDSDNGTNYVDLIAPASVASNRTITLPDATTTVVGTDTTQTLTNKTLGSGLVMGASAVTSATAQASTSGTSIDFTGIPSWVKRITVLCSGVSLSGTQNLRIRLGDSGGFETTGYISTSTYLAQAQGSTAGFDLWGGQSAANTVSGIIVISNITGNTWIASGVLGRDDGTLTIQVAGTKTLSDTLTQVRITTTNGTDTFDAGSINILYE